MIRVMSLVHSICLVFFLIQNVALEETQEAEMDDSESDNGRYLFYRSRKVAILGGGLCPAVDVFRLKRRPVLYSCITVAPSPQAQEAEMDDCEPSKIESHEVEKKPAIFRWVQGIVPYHINRTHYDEVIVYRIRKVMRMIESRSCVVFKDIEAMPPPKDVPRYLWLRIENPDGVRECSHETLKGDGSSAIMVLGYDCMQRHDILHALMHVLGFHDEVTHPYRDKYVRIMWNNIQPKYRKLFWIRSINGPHEVVMEYDPLSVMHFHDRAYTINGGATIMPLSPGLAIKPSRGLSKSDHLKLNMAYHHECNKRKVGHLFQTCHNDLKDEDGTGNDYAVEGQNIEDSSGMIPLEEESPSKKSFVLRN